MVENLELAEQEVKTGLIYQGSNGKEWITCKQMMQAELEKLKLKWKCQKSNVIQQK